MLTTGLAIAGLILLVVAVFAALVSGFSAAAWVIPVGGACVAAALVLHRTGH